MKWYYLNEENEVIGPISETALRQLSACGEIKNETLICGEGSENWITFEKLEDSKNTPENLSRLFKFDCSHCGQHITAEDSQLGMEAQCPSCGGKILVSHSSGRSLKKNKFANYARSKAFIISALILLGVSAFGILTHLNNGKTNSSPSDDLEKKQANTLLHNQENEHYESKPYRLSTGPLPILSRPVPEGFVLIPEGSFTMGDSLDGMEDAPPHEVHLSSFYIGRHEVTRALWNRVRKWGQENGYPDLPVGWDDSPNGESKGTSDKENYPAYWMEWYDVVKWCNAYSEMEGLSPCYLMNGEVIRGNTLLERKNEFLITCEFGRNGYRLPTEAEWEKAARGGKSGLRFPWGDRINQKQANYTAYFSSEPYQEKPTITQILKDTELSAHRRSDLMRIAEGKSSINQFSGQDKGFRHDKVEGKPFHLPVGSFPPNDYGLHDMIGNASEWCWDCYDKDYYRESPKWDSYDKSHFQDGKRLNPVGPPVRVEGWDNSVWRDRVTRGGNAENNAFGCRVAYRELQSHISNGFRLVCR